MVQDMVLPEALNKRQPPDQRSRVRVVCEMQQLIVQEIQDRGQHEQVTNVGRGNKIQNGAQRRGERAEEENHQDRREQHRTIVPRRLEDRGFIGKERMVLDGMALEDARQ